VALKAGIREISAPLPLTSDWDVEKRESHPFTAQAIEYERIVHFAAVFF
jgi:hypothetical protein